MKLPRVSIAKLMVIVGIVALNTAASRAFLEWEWTGLFLIGLALQVGLVCLIRSRTGFRPFWWGFEAFGLAAALAPIFIAWISPGSLDLYITSAFHLVEHLCTLIKDRKGGHSALFRGIKKGDIALCLGESKRGT